MVSEIRSSTAGDTAPPDSVGFFRRLSIGKKRGDSESKSKKPKEDNKPKGDDNKPKGDDKLKEDDGYLSEASDGTFEDPETRRRRKKNWANEYINGPLIEPEPSQVTGLNSSHQLKDHHLKTYHANFRNQTYSSTSTQVDERHLPDIEPFPYIPHKRRQDRSVSNANLDDFYLKDSYDLPPIPTTSRYYHWDRRHISQSDPSRSYAPGSSSARLSRTSRESFSSRSSTPYQPFSGYPGPSTPSPSSVRPPRAHRSKSDIPAMSGPNMSQRPLEQIKRDTKAANRSPHLRKKNFTRPDSIDALDSIGGYYHHDGPFDATLASRNRDKRYSPVEAVKETNMEALKATPYEYVQDSLQKHVPLQGTATVPPGEEDIFGRRMSYEEGADVMREPDAPGGAYKRYDHVPYHPKDYKGKGEPSYTIERDAKEQKRHRRQMGSNGSGPAYEMQPTRHAHRAKSHGASTRQRSISDSGPAGPLLSPTGQSGDNDVRRTSNTGKRLSDGIRRRFGSLRGKHHDDDA